MLSVCGCAGICDKTSPLVSPMWKNLLLVMRPWWLREYWQFSKPEPETNVRKRESFVLEVLPRTAATFPPKCRSACLPAYPNPPEKPPPHRFMLWSITHIFNLCPHAATLLIKGPTEPILEGESITLECLISDSELNISQVHFEIFSKVSRGTNDGSAGGEGKEPPPTDKCFLVIVGITVKVNVNWINKPLFIPWPSFTNKTRVVFSRAHTFIKSSFVRTRRYQPP